MTRPEQLTSILIVALFAWNGCALSGVDDQSSLESTKGLSVYVESPADALLAFDEWQVLDSQEDQNGVVVLTIEVKNSEKDELQNTLKGISTDGVVYGVKSLYLEEEYPEKFDMELSLIPVSLLEL